MNSQPKPAEGAQRRLLIVEDEKIVAKDMQRTLESLGYAVVGVAGSGVDALRMALELRPELILMDIRMPGDIDGVDAASAIRDHIDIPIVFATAFSDPETLERAKSTGPFGYVLKPFRGPDLQAAIEIALSKHGLEASLCERAAKLEMANEELEAFAASVSHDLRSPLRSIDAYAGMLEEDHGPELGHQARDYVRRLRLSAARMAKLIEDLLRLARIARTDLQRTNVDVSEIARTIGGELGGAAPDREVTFIVHDGLRSRCDAGLARIVFENLLGNAWKFTGKTPNPQVEVGARHVEGKPVFFVRDNGAGFDMARAGNLFKTFQRLHNQTDFEGTGVGLATVQRAIQRHGGRIWAESSPGEGAMFSFAFE